MDFRYKRLVLAPTLAVIVIQYSPFQNSADKLKSSVVKQISEYLPNICIWGYFKPPEL